MGDKGIIYNSILHLRSFQVKSRDAIQLIKNYLRSDLR